jgi:ApaG protein
MRNRTSAIAAWAAYLSSQSTRPSAMRQAVRLAQNRRRRVDASENGMTMSQYQFSVSSQTRYLPEQSNPERRQYAFAYTLTIRNTGQVPAQLIARHWIITDSDNRVQEVKGLGVVGHQPLLKPGEQFEYTSWAVIETPVGTMRGAYFCVAEDGERFEAPVPEFALQMPRTLH